MQKGIVRSCAHSSNEGRWARLLAKKTAKISNVYEISELSESAEKLERHSDAGIQHGQEFQKD